MRIPFLRNVIAGQHHYANAISAQCVQRRQGGWPNRIGDGEDPRHALFNRDENRRSTILAQGFCLVRQVIYRDALFLKEFAIAQLEHQDKSR
jgi:hypothetical protein